LFRKFAIIILFLTSPIAWAQFDQSGSGGSGEEAGLEELYDRLETEQAPVSSAPAPKVDTKKEAKVEKEVNTISDLATLAPFKDIAVIQRRFLPKTQRFEFSGSGVVSTNNQFFNNLGLAARGAYYFNEKYGIEVNYTFLSSTERDVTKSLQEDQNISTDSLVEPEGFFSVAFKWVPVYGKIAWFERKIIPFDLYFTPGIGVTSTALGESESTFTLGIGQLFALTKATAVRWDFVWNMYQARVIEGGNDRRKQQNDLYLGIGYSYFIPEAKYR
jgi:outer membrane beta-barrel protein